MAVINLIGPVTWDLTEFEATSGTVSWATTGGGIAGQSVRINPSASAAYAQLRGINATGEHNTNINRTAETWYQGYLYIASLPSANQCILQVHTGVGSSVQVELWLDNTGALTLVGSTTSPTIATLSTGVRYRIQIRATTSATSYASVDGGTEQSCTATAQTAQMVRLGGSGTNTYDIYWSDFIIDTVGFPGAGSVYPMYPAGMGQDQTGWAGGTAFYYQEVEDWQSGADDDDTTYWRSTALGDIRGVTLSDPGDVSDVRAFKALVAARDEGGAVSFGTRVRSSTSTSDTTLINIGATYALYAQVLSTDPSTAAAWSMYNVRRAQIAVRNQTNVAMRCTAIMGCVFASATPATIQPLGAAGQYFHIEATTGRAPIVSPAYGGDWGLTAGAQRLMMGLTHQNTVVATDSYFPASGSGPGLNILLRQFVSIPLAAQTIPAQTITLVCQPNQALASDDSFLAAVGRVVSNDGATVRGSLFALTVHATELGTTTGQRVLECVVASPLAVLDGDRVVIEVGVQCNKASGRPSRLDFRGGTSGMTAGFLQPADGATSTFGMGWIRFAQDLAFTQDEKFVQFVGFETGDEYEMFSWNGTRSISSSIQRTGTYSARMNPTGGATYAVMSITNSNLATPVPFYRNVRAHFSAWFRVVSMPTAWTRLILCYSNVGTELIHVSIDNSGNLTLGGTPIGTVTVDGAWHQLNLSILSGGLCYASLDGAAEVSAMGTREFFDFIRIGPQNSPVTADIHFDDLAWTVAAIPNGDDAGAVLAVPNGPGTYSAWANGTGTDAATVNARPVSTATYLQESTAAVDVGHSFTVPGLASIVADPATQRIAAFRPWILAKEVASTTTAIAVLARIGAVDYLSFEVDAGGAATWKQFFHQFVYHLDPADDQGFDSAHWAGIEVGVYKGNDTSGLQCAAVFGLVWVEHFVSVILPSCANVTVSYSPRTRTGPLNTPFHVSFLPVAGDFAPASYAIYTGAGRTGTLLASGACDGTASVTVSLDYDETGLAEGTNTIYLSIQDTDGNVGDDCNVTVLRDDTPPTATVTFLG